MQAGLGATGFALFTRYRWVLGPLARQAEDVGKSMANFDLLIAATALEHGLVVVTRNVSDFAHEPVVLVNPCDIDPSAQ